MRTFFTVAVTLGLLAAAGRSAAQPDVKPAPEHEWLKTSEGTWDVTLKSMGGEFKGVVVAKMELNGLWLAESLKADLGGLAFEGRGVTSFDPAKKAFINIWIDSMSTSPTITEGAYDKKTKTMTMVGNMPMPDGKSVKATLVTVFKDADTKTFRILCPGPDGKEAEMMEATYKRRAK